MSTHESVLATTVMQYLNERIKSPRLRDYCRKSKLKCYQSQRGGVDLGGGTLYYAVSNTASASWLWFS